MYWTIIIGRFCDLYIVIIGRVLGEKVIQKRQKIETDRFTLGAELIESAVAELSRSPAKLRVALTAGHLEVVVTNPLGDPAQPAVARHDLAPEAQAPQGRAQVGKRRPGQRPHRVPVQRQQRQSRHSGEGVIRDCFHLVEANV